ncbi:murein L,D-transpeptidase [Sinorhizobium meliloti]|nr:L,D-transpeptidase [Sinorhizobium meliloti]ARS69417.1 L,D-transpeptidase [Sinorhizobium meliloti RU11/001]PST28578.1 murein L,D-transpeptidase [Mesorhizobium loti]ASJ58532.1 L,D-transpeptidase [Sinorhizobium meliloti]ASP50614.1 murein L,D-transpeptidase [Sinorhizobium meliloti]ASP57429.1 murein L,D-transpeptidase [Sinorhizobium meliloti]
MAYFGWLAFLTHMFDWTNGCIAVTNAEMDEIRDMVPNNTAIVTNP